MTPDDERVILCTYTTRAEAEVARSVLTAAGIRSEIVADDAGGALPGLHWERGVRLYVDASAEAEARQALES